MTLSDNDNRILIPYGLPQFLDFEPVAFPNSMRRKFREEPIEGSQTDDGKTLVRLCAVPRDSELADNDDVYEIKSDGNPGETHLDMWLDKWLPVPFLSRTGAFRNNNKEEPIYRKGPSNWARAYLRREANGSWRAVLAFDMQVEEPLPDKDNPGEKKSIALSPSDVTSGCQYSLASRQNDNSWFLEEGWVENWLKSIWNDYYVNKGDRYRPKCRNRELPITLDFLASYLVYLEVLKKVTGENLTVSISTLAGSQDKASDDQAFAPVEVDLILDIGNSRSTGYLVESYPNGMTNFNKKHFLQLRDMSQPYRFYSEPFETRVEFSKVDFGSELLSKRSGRRKNAFAWPSPVRTGPEATRLANLSANAEGTSGMSSPKRYLWDQGPASSLWYFNRPSPAAKEELVSTHPVCRYLNNNGVPLFCLQEYKAGSKPQSALTKRFSNSLESFKKEIDLPAAMPKFSRASMMTFLFMELIQQALVTMNAHEQRSSKSYTNLPRRLRSVIFTTPPGMPVAEQRIYRRSAYTAVKLLWDLLGWSEFYVGEDSKAQHGECRDYRMSPVICNRWDEASCTQLVYLYNEITQNYLNDAHFFFEVMGKMRSVPKEETFWKTRRRPVQRSMFDSMFDETEAADTETKPTLRVATIDIGGGTTDISVITHVLSNDRTSTNRIWPLQEFRDGFNFGGDDVLKAVAAEIICSKAFPRALAKAGAELSAARTAMRNEFAHDSSDARIQAQRIKFVRQVIIPIAYELLSQYEKKDRRDTSGEFSVSLRSLFIENGMSTLPGSIREYFRNTFAAPLGIKTKLLELELSVLCEDMDNVITKLVEKKIEALGEAVHAYDCDVLLLSGRPSRWNAVVRKVFSTPPVVPSRIIPMHEYRVGGWYPFSDEEGRITDPKTTVVVGALLCAVAENSIEGFVFDSSFFKLKNTIRFIGQLSDDKLSRDMVWFDNIDPEKSEEYPAEVKFSSAVTIGFRQLDSPSWPATRCWRMEFSSPESKDIAKDESPYTVKITYKHLIDDEEDDLPKEVKKDTQELADQLAIQDIVSRNDVERPGSLRVYMRTLAPEEEHGCWMDTGVLF